MKLISTNTELKEILPVLTAAPCLAVDTEADSLHHYYEKLCLIQISTAKQDFVIDPLGELDTTSLAEVLNTKELIMHGADFDIRMLKSFCNVSPHGIFDTKLAAQFTGYPKPSLAALVEKHFEVVLPKTNQKADWSARPLNESMLAYASNDTHYLHRLKGILVKELNAAGYCAWYEESARLLMEVSLKQKEARTDEQWRRMKGAKELKGKALPLVKELWHWREKEAQRRDRPRFKVLSDERLIKIAQWAAPQSSRVVKDCVHFPQSYKEREKILASIEKAVQKGRQATIDVAPRPTGRKPVKRLTHRHKTLLKRLKEERRRIATEIRLDPSLVVSNSVLEQLVLQEPKDISEIKKTGLMLGWQAGVAGERLFDVLRGARV